MIDNTQKIAQVLLDTRAVRLNVNTPYIFASGIKSPIYCDNRFLLGFPEARNIIIDAFLENSLVQDAEVIAGTSTAGIPWAAIIADHLKKPLAYVRAESKDHGVGKTVEGAEVANKKTVVIEDLISTGASSKKVLDNLLTENALVSGVVAIFSYEFLEVTTVFENTPYHTLSTFSTLLQIARETNILNDIECSIASEWNSSPRTWKI